MTDLNFSRYQRQILLPEVGIEGQKKLQAASVLVVGAGGLGCPVLLYLTAAGVGRIGIVDFDRVDVTNLHRQILYTQADIGQFKSAAAKERLLALNQDVCVDSYAEKLTSDNVERIFGAYDLIGDGSDNFRTRYLINDACVSLHKPFVSCSVQGFKGQVSVFNFESGPCYRCVFPTAPQSEYSPSCNVAGILGVLPGWVGLIQATEVLKIILGIGTPLSGRLLSLDALHMTQQTIEIQKDPQCPACGPTKTESFGHVIKDEVTAQDIQQKLNEKVPIAFLDVRTPDEFSDGAIPTAKNIPLQSLGDPGVLDEIQKYAQGKELIIYCQHGHRSRKAMEFLNQHGISCKHLQDGYEAWLQDKAVSNH